ncbi:MAG: hypothetical protein ABW175_21930 [Bradyrhizobium sp.]
MAHPQAYLAAVDGKLPVNKPNSATKFVSYVRRLLFAAVAFFVASGSLAYAQTGPFAGMAGTWSGGGAITLDDGSSERIRCRATYAVGAGGNGLNLNLTCASDSYKINLSGNVVAQGQALSGTWSEASRGISGNLEGRGGNGTFQVTASAPGFTAGISLRTQGNKQSIGIKSDTAFRNVSISLSRS